MKVLIPADDTILLVQSTASQDRKIVLHSFGDEEQGKMILSIPQAEALLRDLPKAISKAKSCLKNK